MQALPAESRIISEILAKVKETCCKVRKMRDCSLFDSMFEAEAPLNNPLSVSLKLGEGRAEVELSAKEGLFYSTLSEECGEEISDDFTLMRYVKSLKEAKSCYEKFKNALAAAEETGYGVVNPAEGDLVLDAPDMVREGLNAKVVAMPEDAKRKMRRTVTRIVNEGRGGVICILL